MRLCDLSPELLLCIADHLTVAKHINAFAQSFRRAYDCLNHHLLCRFKDDLLRFALGQENPDLLRKVMSLQPDINQCFQPGVTPLVWAVWLGNTALVEALLEGDHVDVHSRYSKDTALECAAAFNEVEMMRLLLSRVDMNVEAASEALFAAVESASLEAVQFLMALNVALNTTRKGVTPLCMAAQCGYVSIQDLLLEDKRVDLNCMNPAREEPVILTLIRNVHHTEAVKLTRLLELHERVNLNVVDAQGNTALHFMAEKGHLLGCSFLVQNYPWMLSWANCRGDTPLFSAIQYLKPDICRYLLEQTDVDLESVNLDGRTPILECAYRGDLKTFKVLVERSDRVRTTVKGNRSHSSLLEAAKSGNDEVVWYLIDEGADPNIQDEEGRTPLMLAACHNQITTVKLLLDAKGIKPGKRDNLGWTAFVWALWPGPESEPNHEISKMLLEKRMRFLLWKLKGKILRRDFEFWKGSAGAPVRISVK